MRKLMWVLGLGAIVALSGCVKMEQDITLNKDGSGNVKFMYAMSEQMISQMEMMAQMGAEEDMEVDDDAMEFDEAKVRKSFEELKDQGITLNSVRSESRGGWKYMHVDFDFQDVAKLGETEAMGESPVTITRNEDGNYVITSTMGGEDIGLGDEEMDPAQMQMMMPMLSGMRIAVKINTPTNIISTTAPVKTARSAQWVFDADEDPESIMKMGQTRMEVIFDGRGVSIPEVN